MIPWCTAVKVAIHEPELPAITVHDTDARHEPDVADVAVAEGLTGKREREEDRGMGGAMGWWSYLGASRRSGKAYGIMVFCRKMI